MSEEKSPKEIKVGSSPIRSMASFFFWIFVGLVISSLVIFHFVFPGVVLRYKSQPPPQQEIHRPFYSSKRDVSISPKKNSPSSGPQKLEEILKRVDPHRSKSFKYFLGLIQQLSQEGKMGSAKDVDPRSWKKFFPKENTVASRKGN